MRGLLVTAMAGGLLGGGIWALLRAAFLPPVPLDRRFADLSRDPSPPVDSRWEQRVAARLAPRLLGRDPGGTRAADLAIVERTAAQQIVAKAMTAGALVLIVLATGSLMLVATVPIPPAIVLVAAIVMGAVGWIVPDLEVRGRAAARRKEFVAALSAYLDVVAILLAGGTGTETALYTAAELGGGWPFARLRRALDRSRLSAAAPWRSLEQLGQQLRVTELEELAAAAAVAGRHGAHVRQSLTARAAGLRATQLAAVEEDAAATTEKMTAPLVVLGVSFLGFILFPALMQILQAST